MNHTVKINSEDFELIKTHKKDLEIRLYDDKRRLITLGDTITFYRAPELSENVTKKVIGFAVFSNFIELFKSIDVTRAGRGQRVSQEEAVKHNEKYYSKEDQDKYGLMGIFLGD